MINNLLTRFSLIRRWMAAIRVLYVALEAPLWPIGADSTGFMDSSSTLIVFDNIECPFVLFLQKKALRLFSEWSMIRRFVLVIWIVQ